MSDLWLVEATELRRQTDALPPLSPGDQRIGGLAQAHLVKMTEMEQNGYARWDARLNDWVMTPSHPAYGIEDPDE